MTQKFKTKKRSGGGGPFHDASREKNGGFDRVWLYMSCEVETGTSFAQGFKWRYV